MAETSVLDEGNIDSDQVAMIIMYWWIGLQMEIDGLLADALKRMDKIKGVE